MRMVKHLNRGPEVLWNIHPWRYSKPNMNKVLSNLLFKAKFGVEFNILHQNFLIVEGSTVHCRNVLNFPCCHSSSSTSSGEIKGFKKLYRHILQISSKVYDCKLGVVFGS